MSVDREFFTVHCVLLKTLMKLFFFNFAILLHKKHFFMQYSVQNAQKWTLIGENVCLEGTLLCNPQI